MNLPSLPTILALLYLLFLTSSLSSSPTLQPNSIYSSAGTFAFDTSPYLGTTNNLCNFCSITIPFNGRNEPTNTYRFGYSIQDFNYEIVSNNLNFSLELGSKAATSAAINFYTNNANKISTLKISYLIIQPFFGVYYFSFKWLKPQRNFDQTISNNPPYIQTSTTQGPFNMASTFTTWATILGVEATLAANNQIDLYPTVTVVSSSSISYRIQTISPTIFYLQSVLVQAFVYDSSQLQALNRNALITLGSFGNTNIAGLTATDATNSVRSYNTIIGLIGFHIVSLSYLQFTTTINPNNVMQFTSSYTFSYVNFNYLIAQFVACGASTPYLEVSSRTCYDVCPIPYSTDSNYYECTICGDGYKASNENCDDGNTVNGDGCSNMCQIETNFSCTNNSSNTSVCSLTAITIDYQSVIKDEFSNSVTLIFKVTPNSNTLKTLDWPAITSQISSLGLNFSAFSYDSSNGQLQITAQYTRNLSNQFLAMQFAFPNSVPFSLLGIKNTSLTLSASNNLALQVYEPAQYQAALILRSIVLVLTALALLLFLLGYYSGKLIALELISIFQLTFFSLLSAYNLSPSFVALKALSYSTIYNLVLFPKASKSSITQFSLFNYDLNFANDFNIASLLVIFPLIISLILFLVNKLKYSSQSQALIRYSGIFKGEIAYYGLMLTMYPSSIAFFAIARQIKDLKADQTIIFSFSSIWVLLMVVYAGIHIKYAEWFGQFAEHIKIVLCDKMRMYLLIQISTILISILLAFLRTKYVLFIVISFLFIQLVFIAVQKPYILSGGFLRPTLNLIVSIAIQLCIAINQLFRQKLQKIPLILPFIIAGLLFLSLAYNTYFFIKQFQRKKTQNEREQKKQAQILKSQAANVTNFYSALLAQTNGSILKSTLRIQNDKHENNELQDGVVGLKHHLGSIKHSSLHPEVPIQAKRYIIDADPKQIPTL